MVLLALLAGFGTPQSASLTPRLLSFGGAMAFVIAAAISVRTAANEVARVAALRAGPGTASGLRLGLTVVGYLVTTIIALTVLRVPIEKLLLSGAITGVVIGIAAQQALANLFAGSRPADVPPVPDRRVDRAALGRSRRRVLRPGHRHRPGVHPDPDG